MKEKLRLLGGTPHLFQWRKDLAGTYRLINHVWNHNITVNAALNWAKDRLFNPSTSEVVAKYLAVSTNTGAGFAAGDTSLADEVTDSGLARAAGTYSVAGCSTGECILYHQWTVTGTKAIKSMGLFDETGPPVAGNLVFEAAIDEVNVINGDLLTGKWDKITF